MALAFRQVRHFIASAQARRREVLERAAAEIAAETGAETVAVVADVTTQQGRDAILAACLDPDILVNNAGGPPPGDFRRARKPSIDQ